MSRDERPARSDSGSEWSSAFRRDSDADGQTEGESLHFGCSMLSRIRMRPRTPGVMRPFRCSLGYALTSDDDTAKCLAVEGPSSCWKAAAPTWRVPALQEEPAQTVDPLANGHVYPEVGEMEAQAEHGEMDPPIGDEVIEIELTSVEVTVDDA